MNDIPNTPMPNPTPAGISIAKSKFATELTYNSYSPSVDKITALSTPGTIDEPATAIPRNTDCNKCTTLTWDDDSEEVVCVWGQGVYGNSLYSLLSSVVNLKFF